MTSKGSNSQDAILQRWRLIRDVALFMVGLGGIIVLLIHWLVSGERPDEILAVIFTSMVGLPIALHKDEGP